MLPRVVAPGGLDLPTIYALFPNLLERARSQGTKLSGGEQQMLAIARILRTGARLLLLDEPTEGLAPVIVKQIGRTIRAIKSRGFTVLLVEQNFRFAETVADRHYIMEHGRVVDMIPTPNWRAAWASCTNTSASERRATGKGKDASIARHPEPGCRTDRRRLTHHHKNGETMQLKRRTLLGTAAAAAALPATGRRARAQAATIKIGVLNDMSGPYRDISGPSSVAAVKMAVEEFGCAWLQCRGVQRRPPEQA